MALASPGIFWANSGVITQYKDVLPYNTYVQWYENIHIPDWMGAKSGAINAAWRYQCLDSSRATPFLVTYRYPDISAMSAPEFRNVRTNDSSLLNGESVFNFVDLVSMSGPHIETWKSGSTGDERGPILVSEVIDPADNTTEQFHDWYHETYINEISQIGGWRRTSRFDTSSPSGGARKGRLSGWLALHEFEGWSFDENTTTITSLLGKSEETTKMEKSAKHVDLSLYKLVRVYGDGATPWGQPGEDKIL